MEVIVYEFLKGLAFSAASYIGYEIIMPTFIDLLKKKATTFKGWPIKRKSRKH